MKDISTLIEDIYDRLHRWKDVPLESVKGFGESLSTKLAKRLSEEHSSGKLRFSNLGMPDRKLWYSVNHPELGEGFSGETLLKFQYGDILEEYILFLAKEAGHTVECEQMEVEVVTELGVVPGHIDAIIDGMLVDLKSASPIGFGKFKTHLTPEQDNFGYLSQLGSYLGKLAGHPSIRYPDEAAFLAIEKVSGELCLDKHQFDVGPLEGFVKNKQKMLLGPKPERCFEDEKSGESGNRKLGMVCSYCDYKKDCWPGLKLVVDTRPVYMTNIARPPKWANGHPKKIITL
jgi:hypothetical protein